MLYSKIIAVCSQIHTKHINTLCGQNVELISVKLAVNIETTGLQTVNVTYTSYITSLLLSIMLHFEPIQKFQQHCFTQLTLCTPPISIYAISFVQSRRSEACHSLYAKQKR